MRTGGPVLWWWSCAAARADAGRADAGRQAARGEQGQQGIGRVAGEPQDRRLELRARERLLVLRRVEAEPPAVLRGRLPDGGEQAAGEGGELPLGKLAVLGVQAEVRRAQRREQHQPVRYEEADASTRRWTPKHLP